MNILIAEDDPVSCRILARTLSSWGHDVSVATDGMMAWDMLQPADSPAMAILDIMMPEMDGCDVCRKVRELSYAIPPYLILLTAMSTKDDLKFSRGICPECLDRVTSELNARKQELAEA